MSATETPEGAPRVRLGPRQATLRATMAAVVLVVVWMVVTGLTGGPGVGDPAAWRLLLVTSMLVDVGLLLTCEWLARKPGAGADPRAVTPAARAAGWAALALLVTHAAVLVVALVPGAGAVRRDGTAAWWVIAAGTALVVANLGLGVALRRLAVRHGFGGVSARSSADPSDEVTAPAPAAPYVVACSGGGIRAAAFVLGGINALQSLGPATRTRTPRRVGGWATDVAPRLVAVSGGSYAAAAVSLTRVFEVHDGRVDIRREPLPWRSVYAPDSPEMKRLRRHTRDLFEPGREVALGVGSLVLGAAVNVFLALAVLRLAATVVAWVSTRAGDLQLLRTCAPAQSFCTFADGFRGRAAWWTDETVLVWLLLTLVSVGAGVWLWVVQGRINRFRPGQDPDRHRRRDALARVRVWSQYASGAWLVAFLLLPATVAGLNHLALANSPTPSVAGVVRTLGFATEDQCVAAGGRDVARAVSTAGLDARISPGEKRSASGGACGVVVDVTLTVGDPATCPARPGSGGCSPTPGLWTALGEQRVRADLRSSRVGDLTKALGSLATFFALLQTLRRSVSADDGTAGRGGTLRRLVLMRLPILVVAVLGLWLLGRWVFHAAVGPTTSTGWPDTVVPLAALLVGLVLDANVTSMHDYYRSRLANAFAAARGPEEAPGGGERAVPLPATHYYRFSELGEVPLTIATTANVQAYDSVPTRRGGAPLTVDERNLELHGGRPETSRRVAVEQYEDAVGHGYASIMSIVAMSGAAVSPMMGRFAASFGPFRALLALFNIRIGVWVPNPRFSPPEEMQGHDDDAWGAVRRWPERPWLTGRPGAMQVVAEAFGRSSFDDQWLYLTDGGHLDNTGIVEAVRVSLGTAPGARGWRRVLALDASNDKEGTWSAVGDALAIVRADLGVRLERRDSLSRSFAPAGSATSGPPAEATRGSGPPAPTTRRGLLRRAEPAAPAEEPHYARVYEDPERRVSLLVVKAVRPVDLEHADLPDSVRAFAMSTTDFPRASTSRQDFSDLEFEAYRALGEWCTSRAVAGDAGRGS